MRKNIGVKPLMFPQPVLIIATYDEDGKPNAMNAAWGGTAGVDKIMIHMSHHKTTDNILLKKAFTVSFGDAAHMLACDYVGIVSANKEPRKMEKAGFTTTKSAFVDAPMINELPLTLECEFVEILGENNYLGRIVNISAEESILGEDGAVSLEKFFPLIFDSAHYGYYRFGEKVGQAFEDGKKLY